jgi:hypothetical protein
MRSVRPLLLVALLLAAGTTACEKQPTSTAMSGSRAHFDGGVGLGSGHRGETDSTSTSTFTNSPPSEDGGVGLGSGH